VTMLENPLPAYRFVITLDPGDAYLPPAQAQLVPLVAAGAFEEVSGLSAELEVVSYPEGGVNGYVHQLPLRHSWGRITLRRGVVRDPGLWSWYEAGLTQSLGARRSGVVLVLTPDGLPAVAWSFKAGLAAKWTGPTLQAEQNAVAVESIEIAHQGLTRELLSEREEE
jgi:phage tail-like protein